MQTFKKQDSPAYIPTEEDNQNPYFKKLLEQVDLTCLEEKDPVYRNNFAQWYEDLQTEEKVIR